MNDPNDTDAHCGFFVAQSTHVCEMIQNRRQSERFVVRRSESTNGGSASSPFDQRLAQANTREKERAKKTRSNTKGTVFADNNNNPSSSSSSSSSSRNRMMMMMMMMMFLKEKGVSREIKRKSKIKIDANNTRTHPVPVLPL